MRPYEFHSQGRIQAEATALRSVILRVLITENPNFLLLYEGFVSKGDLNLYYFYLSILHGPSMLANRPVLVSAL